MVRLSVDRRLDRLESAAMLTGEQRFAEVLRTLSDDEFYDVFAPVYDGRREPRTDAERGAYARFVALGGEHFWLMALGARSAYDVRPATTARVTQVTEPLLALHRQRFERVHRRRTRDAE